MKKRLSLFLSFLLLLSLCACARPAPVDAEDLSELSTQSTEIFSSESPSEETRPSPNLISTEYYALTLPDNWQDTCIFEITPKKDGTYILNLYEKTSREEFGAGKLCSLMLFPSQDKTYTDFPDYQLLAALDTPEGSFHLISLFPTDVQFSENTVAAYNALFDQLPEILNTLRPTSGIEITLP